MPDWLKDLFVIVFFAAIIIWALASGKIFNGVVTVTREEEPYQFYTFIGLFCVMITTCVLIALTQAGMIPDFIRGE